MKDLRFLTSFEISGFHFVSFRYFFYEEHRKVPFIPLKNKMFQNMTRSYLRFSYFVILNNTTLCERQLWNIWEKFGYHKEDRRKKKARRKLLTGI